MAKEKGSFNFVNFIVLVAVLVLFVYVFNLSSSVNKLNAQTSGNASPTITSASYTCDNGKTIQAQYFNNTVELELSGGQNMLLIQGLSGSGVRYSNSDESFVFWNKGNTAFVEEGPNSTVTYANCVETTPN